MSESKSALLEQHADVFADVEQLGLTHRLDGPAVDEDRARIGSKQSENQLEQLIVAVCAGCARGDGFDPHACVVVPARDRARLERVCRYALRPPVADDRIRLTSAGQVLLELRHRWRDGTTHLLFDPLELLERLASLTPRPRINLVLYYGVLGAHAAWRARLGGGEAVASRDDAPGVRPQGDSAGAVAAGTSSTGGPAARRRGSNLLWAQLMQRSFGFDVLVCPRCGGRLRLLALIEDPRIIQRILRHLGLPTEIPAARAPRASPLPFGGVPIDHTLASP